MKLVLCMDDRGGLAFGHKRQSSDRLLRQDLMQLGKTRGIYMDAYSFGQFESVYHPMIHVYPSTPPVLDAADYLFIERSSPTPFLAAIHELVVYKWNRHYPADLFFTLDLSGWKINEIHEFTGYSHPKITRITYLPPNERTDET